MSEVQNALPLNAIRAFVVIARERSVTKAALTLGTTQSAVSRHLAVLESYLGSKLIERRGRYTELTDFGQLFASAVTEPYDSIEFAVQRMKRGGTDKTRLVVRTSLSTFAYTILIPRLQEFSNEVGGAVVDVVSSLSQPVSTDDFDVLLSRDLSLPEPCDQWPFLEEQLVCVGPPRHVRGKGLEAIESLPILTIISRPDILPAWLRSHGISRDRIKNGARYDHHYLALPAVTTGRCLLVAPEIVVIDLVRQGLLEVVEGSRVRSGMQYRAFATDRSKNPELARAFCRWLVRLTRTVVPDAAPR